jgi:DNA-binding PadR family transcriptional regulator
LKRTYLTDFELMLLLAVLRVGDQAYGAVYAGLDRLEANGLVASSIGDPTPERGGRAKRYFRVTPTGMKAVRQTRRALTNLWAGVPGLDGGRA